MSAESFKAYLGRVQTAVKQKSGGIQIAALKSLEAEHKTRIFNEGKTTAGASIGYYTQKYGDYREDNDRQAQYVDLVFYGNLTKAIQIGKSQGRNVYGFINTYQRKIAEGNTKRFKRAIFTVSQNEAKDLSRRVGKGLQIVIRNV